MGSEEKVRSAAGLPNRAVLRMRGEDARDFLDKLITADMDHVAPGKAIHAALLTPQGKIISDFFVTEADSETGGGFYLDTPLVSANELIKRFTLYKLRAKVTIEDLSQEIGVIAVWGDESLEPDVALAFPDPRLPLLGLRIIGHKSQFNGIADAFNVSTKPDSEIALQGYHQHRAKLGLGEAVFDYMLGNTFPHDINMDQLGGVDFKKGCYIGQEVVSRMQHRGTARTRLVPLLSENGFSVAENIPVMVGERPIGMTGTGSNGMNLGLIRLDKAAEAMAAGSPITAGAIEVWPQKPFWWNANWPIAET